MQQFLWSFKIHGPRGGNCHWNLSQSSPAFEHHPEWSCYWDPDTTSQRYFPQRGGWPPTQLEWLTKNGDVTNPSSGVKTVTWSTPNPHKRPLSSNLINLQSLNLRTRQKHWDELRSCILHYSELQNNCSAAQSQCRPCTITSAGGTKAK